MKRTKILMAMALIAAAPPLAHADATSWTISGVVVSATTGAPLDRAEVTLSTTGADGTEFAQTVTGETGAFRFDGVQTGKYALAASRRGFLPSSYQEHEGYFTAIVAGPNLDTQNLRVELTPYGSISGTISDDSGNPVSDARVTLFRQDDSTGEAKVSEAGSATTDDAGNYEFARLQSGTYYVDVSAHPWFAFRPSAQTNLSTGQQDDPTPSPLDVAYPLTFYPNAPDSSSATPIQINAGERAQANFSLHAVPAIHIELHLAATPGRRGGTAPDLVQEAFGTEQSSQSLDVGNVAYDRRNNTMTVYYGPVAPGHYELRQNEGAVTSIDATSSRTLDGLAAAATVDVRGRFAMASGAPLPERPVVFLRPVDGHLSLLNSPVGRDGSFDFANVAPGTYEVHLSGSLVAVQMAASGGEVRGSQITIGSDSVLLAATLASGSATVNGYVVRGDKGVGGTMVLLVPSDPKTSDELIRRDQSDSDGSFSLPNVVPGTYTLVAIENGWGLEWKHRDAIAAYLKRGVTVQVPENERTMNLEGPVAVQDR
jgi:Carboxypeptidase regulatory-like domain